MDIYKVAGIIIKDRKLLVTRSKGKNFFVSPGGKLEGDESAENALKRELKEELTIDIGDAFQFFGKFYAQAQGQEGKSIEMDVFTVSKWEGEITPSSEIEEIRWIDSKLALEIELGSIFKHDIVPQLKTSNLID